VAISVDAPDVSRDLAQKAGYSFPLLSDQNTEVIKRYDLVHAGAGENGHDIARPAEFLVDSTGTVRWINLTENYWVRTRPEQVLEVSKIAEVKNPVKQIQRKKGRHDLLSRRPNQLGVSQHDHHLLCTHPGNLFRKLAGRYQRSYRNQQ
jgi:alkyl hydroperoxide reductase subunit AhpC